MTWIVGFIASAVAFGTLDAIWLKWAGPNFYRQRLHDILAENFRMGPALVFYLVYNVAIVWFAVRPGLASGLDTAAFNGALLGAICYATYDLTNQATMRRWSTLVTVVDIAWGAFATSCAATVATYVAAKLA